jgi:3-methylfumaryl-CoA hydratase
MADAEANLTDWIGRTDTAADHVSEPVTHAIAATFDRAAPAAAEPLPPLWHWCFFLPTVPMRDLGPDGHPRRGGFLPPVTLPRRMWAGSRLELLQPLAVGEPITRHSRIADVQVKQGRSGALTLVTVQHEISGRAGLAIREQQDIVYRAAAEGAQPMPAGTPPAQQPHWSRTMTADPVLLFRFSALMFNSHRIHYDLPYARDVEGYPALVVHGPLTLMLLVDELHRQRPDATLEHVSMRALRPLFAGDPFALEGRIDGREVALWTVDRTGAMTMQANAVLAAP